MSPDDPTVLPGVLVKHKRVSLASEYDHDKKSSNLFAPKQRLEDHKDTVLTCDIDPTGELILSGGSDCLVRICPVYTDEGYVMVMSGHTMPIKEVSFSYNGTAFYTCSTDKTVASWDTCRGLRLHSFEGHTDDVNSVKRAGKSQIICSGSRDGTVRIWDLREKNSTANLTTGYQVHAVSFLDNEKYLVSAGDNSDIHLWDIRTHAVVSNLSGHTDGVTGIEVSPCGAYLLSHSYDSTLCTWEIRPTEALIRPRKIFPSNQGIHCINFLRCSWSQYGGRIAAGNANAAEVNIWDSETCQILHNVRGHKDCVNDIKFHPYEPIILTASNDKHLLLQELPD